MARAVTTDTLTIPSRYATASSSGRLPFWGARLPMRKAATAPQRALLEVARLRPCKCSASVWDPRVSRKLPVHHRPMIASAL
jgi:hypothetical protein